MKKIIALVTAAVWLAVLVLPAQAAEEVPSFAADISISKQSEVRVVETITYDFGSDSRHGIYRDIPTVSTNGPTLVIDVLGVTDGNGAPYNYEVLNKSDVVSIKIGDPNEVVTGKNVYVVSYLVRNAIRYFSDHDELYWNVTGDRWQATIASSSAIVHLPSEIPLKDLGYDCYVGVSGSNAACSSGEPIGSAEAAKNVYFSHPAPLDAGEGLTIDVSMPKGVVDQVAYVEPRRSQFSLEGNWILSVFLSIWALFFFGGPILALVKFARGRKMRFVVPKELKHKPVVVAYAPPAGVLPVDAGYLADRTLDGRDITAVILDLAVHGYLKIRRTTSKILFWTAEDYEITKLKDKSDLEHPAYKAVMTTLFGLRGGPVLKLSDLKKGRAGYALYTTLKDVIAKYVKTNGFLKEPESSPKTYLTIFLVSIFVFGAAIWGLGGPAGAIFGIFMGLVTGTVVSIFVFVSQRFQPTPKGLDAISTLMGYKVFLEATDKDKLALLNAPEMNAETFEKNLPYAVVFGVEEKWAAKFEGIYTDPAWFEGGGNLGAVAFAHSLSSLSGSFNSAMVGAHSSGSGGGGFSGGGSGGGGGGSW